MTEPRTDDTEMIELPSAPERWPGGPDGTASTTPSAADAPDPAPAPRRRGGSALRWGVAVLGILIVVAGTAVIVNLAGGRPAASSAMGYMPTTAASYVEARLDLPGDQRQKLAAFLANFPGFKDQSQVEPKLNDVLDRIVRAATDNRQTWTADIAPWFGGQVAVATGTTGAPASMASFGMSSIPDTVSVVTIKDRAKAIAWIESVSTGNPPTRSTYNGADLLTTGSEDFQMAIAVTDRVLIVGLPASVKAAVDTNGTGTLAANDDVKAALATLEKDHVAFAVYRLHAQYEAMFKQLGEIGSTKLADTQLDETVLGILPAWQAMTARFESDAIVATSAGPSWSIGYDTANHGSSLAGHVPSNTIAYLEGHDVGKALTAVLDKFRALPEAKPAFDQMDQALNLLGGWDDVAGWWGDAAFVVSPLPDGTVGGGVVIKPTDPAAADEFVSKIGGFLAIGGSSAGVTSRTVNYNGTTVTVVDIGGVQGMGADSLPPGYKPEIAWATNADVTVIGYGEAWVNAVLDAGPGTSLADNARFKDLLGRVGAENIAASWVDVAGIRTLIEPLAQSSMSAEEWKTYTTEIKPYLEHLDAVIQATRKDGGLDRSSGQITAR